MGTRKTILVSFICLLYKKSHKNIHTTLWSQTLKKKNSFLHCYMIYVKQSAWKCCCETCAFHLPFKNVWKGTWSVLILKHLTSISKGWWVQPSPQHLSHWLYHLVLWSQASEKPAKDSCSLKILSASSTPPAQHVSARMNTGRRISHFTMRALMKETSLKAFCFTSESYSSKVCKKNMFRIKKIILAESA